MVILEALVNCTGTFMLLPFCRRVRISLFQSNMALLFLSQSFPKIRILSLDSSTWKEVSTLILPIRISTLSTIPSDLALAPFAVRTSILEFLLILYPSLSSKGLVMMQVAAPLSIIAVTACLATQRVHLAAEVSSPSLSARLASLESLGSFSRVLLTALISPERYLGISWAACPTDNPQGS